MFFDNSTTERFLRMDPTNEPSLEELFVAREKEKQAFALASLQKTLEHTQGMPLDYARDLARVLNHIGYPTTTAYIRRIKSPRQTRWIDPKAIGSSSDKGQCWVLPKAYPRVVLAVNGNVAIGNYWYYGNPLLSENIPLPSASSFFSVYDGLRALELEAVPKDQQLNYHDLTKEAREEIELFYLNYHAHIKPTS
jgi:hypothetical protein